MFIIVDNGSNCDCYKCEEKKAVKEFVKSIENISKTIGFTPRSYDLKYNFYKFLDDGISFELQAAQNMVANLSSNEKINIINTLKKTIEHNNDFKIKYKDKKLVYCRDCGRAHLKIRSSKIENEYLCKNCFDYRYFICHHCKKIDYKYNFKQSSSGNMVCHSCVNSLYDACPYCGRLEEKGEAVKITLAPKSIGELPTTMCRNCASAHIPCSICGYYFNVGKGNAHAHKTSGKKFICKSCQMLNVNFIEDWKFKPNPIFWAAPGEKLSTDTLMYGVEFEIIHRDSTENGTKEFFAGKIRDHIGRKFVYCKHDGSVKIDDKPYGFEIVTQPFSHEYYTLNKRRIDSIFNWLLSQGAETNFTTGLHIHLSKAAFGTFHLYKFLRFYYSKSNENFIYFISQRNNRDWFNHYSPFRESDRKTLPEFSKAKINVSGERHSAISLMMPATVEVRIFQMFMDSAIFHKNIEFCKATYDFSKFLPFQDMTYQKFIIFVKDNKKVYPNLYEFIKNNGEKFFPKKGFRI